ncbi:MAG: type II toxin-antitoxin system VapC family toxin [Gemmatimonadetes bacterium]|nr:type II toxin-antitoxin system VapC family toxin [Gemmatimonadota bacterium]
MILLDTSALVDCLAGARRSGPALRRANDRGERVQLPALVLYEWLRGPRLPEELAYQEILFPRESALAFGPAEAARAAELYRELPRTRGREVDLAIAATALVWDARLWTLNLDDFKGVPGLVVERPA